MGRSGLHFVVKINNNNNDSCALHSHEYYLGCMRQCIGITQLGVQKNAQGDQLGVQKNAQADRIGTSEVNTGTGDQMFTHSYTGVPCTTDVHNMVQFLPPGGRHPDQGAQRGLP